MNQQTPRVYSRVNDWQFNGLIFTSSFLAICILVTLQMYILGDYINYTQIPLSHIIAIVAIWTAVATGMTVVIIRQINRKYRQPIAQFAKAA